LNLRRRLEGELPLTCVECGATSDEGAGWKTYVVDEAAGETATYCPDCPQEEFSDA
jgi:hypothetical protein